MNTPAVSSPQPSAFSPMLKWAYTLFVAVLVPVYWYENGPTNFLWFSDIALLVTLVALWLESRLLASMMAVCVLLPEIVWNLDFLISLIAGPETIGLTAYMFNSQKPIYTRLLSLFHVFIPVVLALMVYRLGYDRRALPLQTLVAGAVFLLTYLVTEQGRNINWVHGFGEEGPSLPSPWLHLLALMVLMPLAVFLPTHWLLDKWRGPARFPGKRE